MKIEKNIYIKNGYQDINRKSRNIKICDYGIKIEDNMMILCTYK